MPETVYLPPGHYYDVHEPGDWTSDCDCGRPLRTPRRATASRASVLIVATSGVVTRCWRCADPGLALVLAVVALLHDVTRASR
jgi:hypothetical protein